MPRCARGGTPTRRGPAWRRATHDGRSNGGRSWTGPEVPIARRHVIHDSECDSPQRGYRGLMSVKVRVPTTLRTLTGGKSEVEVEGATVGEVINNLESTHPGFADRLLDENGLRRFVN